MAIETKRYYRSIVDRLSDYASSGVVELYCDGEEVVESVRNNIQTILNSRLPLLGDYFLHAESSVLNESLLCFGIIDFQTITLEDEAMERKFCKSVIKAIENFEPRIDDLTVELHKSVRDRAISLKMEASLNLHPRKQISLTTGYDLDHNCFVLDQIGTIK